MLRIYSIRLSQILFFFAILFFASASSSFAETAQFILKSASNNIAANQTAVIEIYVQSDTPVNAAQINLNYPVDVFQVTTDLNGSAFEIKTQDTVTPSSITIVNGNIMPLSGYNLFAKLNVKGIRNGQVSQFQTAAGTQILTSNGNYSIYTSTINDVPGVTNPTIPVNVTTTPKKEVSKKRIFFQAIKEFFIKLFRF